VRYPIPKQQVFVLLVSVVVLSILTGGFLLLVLPRLEKLLG
jgi:hypothetical protein